MLGKVELRVLSYLDSSKSRQELANESGYLASTTSRALGNLERLDFIFKERAGNQTVARPANNHCVEVFQSLPMPIHTSISPIYSRPRC